MTIMRILNRAILLLMSSAWLGSQAAAARTITIIVEPATASLAELTLEKRGETPSPIQRNSDGTYSIEEPVPAEGATTQFYTIVASWKDSTRSVPVQFYMKAPSTADPKLWIYPMHAPATTDYIEGLRNAGSGFGVLLKSYQMARDIWRREPNKSSDVAVKAYACWEAAAKTLAGAYSFMAPDEDLIAWAANEETAPARKPLKKTELKGYLDYWKDASEISEAYASGRYDDAARLNTRYIEEYQMLSPVAKKAVVKYYGINGALLESNAAAISNKLAEPLEMRISQ